MIKYSTIVLWLFFCIDGCLAQHITLKVTDTIKEGINLTADFMEFQDDILLSANGDFRTLKTKKASIVLCNDITRNTFIYAAPEETIEIQLSPKGLIEYSCKTNKFRKLESEFINLCYQKYGSTENRFTKEFVNSINRPGLSKYIDPKYIKEQEMLGSFYKDKLVSKEFYDYFMTVYWCLTLFNEIEDSSLSKERISEIENSYDKADYYLDFQQYRLLLCYYTQKAIENLGIKATLADNLKFTLANYKNQKIRDYLLYHQMRTFLREHHERNSVGINTIQLFRENCKNKLFLEEINKDLEPPTTPVFIENIIKKYRGRLVLVDFWASWCMPCRQEFPHEKALMKKYPNVSFVFVSIDKSNAAWQKVSEEYPDMLNKENSYLLLKSAQDKLLQKINIATIPRFVLFNKNGEIIDINAPRPSSKEIEILIEKYL